MVEVIEANQDCRYTQQELMGCLESLDVKVGPTTPNTPVHIRNRVSASAGNYQPKLQSEEHL